MKYKDECNHGADAYIDTFTHEDQEIDIYLFGERREVCLRYGSEGPDYYSPGTLDEVLYRDMPLYRKALEVLAQHGHKPERNYKKELSEVQSTLARCLCILYAAEREPSEDHLARIKGIIAEAYETLENHRGMSQ
jgi:hypothetical protein